MIKVLFVDDEPQLLKIAKNFMERDGEFAVDSVESTTAADTMRKDNAYDCLVVDYQMPGEDGLEYLKRLRLKGDKVAYILFTGHSHEELAIDALNSGADFYLRKAGGPKVKFAELSNLIRQAVTRRRALNDVEKLALMVEESSEAIVSADLEGNLTTWNKGAERIYGARAEDVIGKNAFTFFPKERLDEFSLILDKARRGEAIDMLDTQRLRADGSRIYTSASYFPLRESHGEIIGVAAFIKDMTAQRLAEQRLRASEKEFEDLVHSSPCIICRISLTGETLFVNDYIKTVTGYDRADIIGKDWWDLFYPGTLREQVDSLSEIIAKKDLVGYEMVLQDRHGRNRTILWTSFNRYDETDGRLLEINGVGLDVTEARAAEEGLRESGLFNRAVLDSLSAHIAVIDRSGRIVAVNDAWERFARRQGGSVEGRLGYGVNYLDVTKKAADHAADGAKEALAGIHDVMKGRLSTFTMEYACDTPQEMLWFHMRVTPLSKRRGGVVISHTDVTDRKLIEQALRMSEQRYRTIFETTGTAIAMLAEDGTVMLMNTELERISEYSKMEVEGKLAWHIFVAPKDLPRIVEYNSMRRADPTRAPRSYEFDGLTKTGKTRHLLATADLIPGTANTLVSLLDITDRKATDEMVRVANRKLSMLGSMTRHDISNQLTVLYASLDRVLSPAGDDRNAKLAEAAKEACQKIQRLLEFARDYQNAGTHEPEWMDLAGTVQRAVDHFKGAGPEFVFDLGRVELRADPMLEKVFYNLVDNSMRHGGHVTRISLSADTGDNGLTITCADDGTGIPAEDKERIFEQGFGRNTGYGLYLVREILAITGLTIKETGVPGQGARFEIQVPPEAHRTAP